MEFKTTSCCGLREFKGLSPDPIQNLKTIANTWFGGARVYGAFILFSDTKESGYGEKLCKYIRNHNLGSVKTTSFKRNPNSGNDLRIYIWETNDDAFRAWKTKKHEKKPIKKTTHGEISVGDRVIYTSGIYGNSDNNPLSDPNILENATVGIVETRRGSYLPINVRWNNGHLNSYDSDDLILIE